jgi:hypothetical protein
MTSKATMPAPWAFGVFNVPPLFNHPADEILRAALRTDLAMDRFVARDANRLAVVHVKGELWMRGNLLDVMCDQLAPLATSNTRMAIPLEDRRPPLLIFETVA